MKKERELQNLIFSRRVLLASFIVTKIERNRLCLGSEVYQKLSPIEKGKEETFSFRDVTRIFGMEVDLFELLCERIGKSFVFCISGTCIRVPCVNSRLVKEIKPFHIELSEKDRISLLLEKEEEDEGILGLPVL